MSKQIIIIISIIFIAITSLFIVSKKTENTDIIVSIKPLHSLVCALTKGIAKPVLLLDGFVSPHHAHLQPSQVQQLRKAKIFLWIGPAYEQMLVNHVNQLKGIVVTLQKSNEIKLKSLRNGALWDEHSCCDHGHDHDHHHHHDHDLQEANLDGHFWLNPLMMLHVVDIVLEHLKKLYPHQQNEILKNAETYKQHLLLLHQQLLQKMESYKGSTYIIQHDGTQYFDATYNVRAIATLSVDPNIPPSAGHILKIRQAMEKGKISPKCLYAEKQINAALAKTYADSLGISFAVIDYLGTSIEPGEKAYEMLMHVYVDEFIKGLR